MEQNETIIQAVEREIREECGFSNLKAGPVVWYWEHDLVVRGTGYRSCDHFSIVRTEDSFVPVSRENDEEKDLILEYRWWEIDDIKKSAEIFTPPGLAGLLQELVENGGNNGEIINI